MAWGDYLSESFADRFDAAGNVLMLVAASAGTVGLFSGFTPLLVSSVGMVVPPAYGLLNSIARNIVASRPEKAVAADPEQEFLYAR